MTTRTRLPRAERERLMLDAARALFAARGYAAVTMDEVAADVGVTKPLLYTYFGNKENLYLACMQPAGDALQTAVVDAVRGSSDAAQALQRGIHAFFAFVDSDRDAWRVLFDESTAASAAVAARVAEVRDRLTRLVTDALLDAMPPSRRRRAAVEVEAMSTAFLGAAEALARWWLRGQAITAAQAADLLIANLAPGLRARLTPTST